MNYYNSTRNQQIVNGFDENILDQAKIAGHFKILQVNSKVR